MDDTADARTTPATLPPALAWTMTGLAGSPPHVLDAALQLLPDPDRATLIAAGWAVERADSDRPDARPLLELTPRAAVVMARPHHRTPQTATTPGS